MNISAKIKQAVEESGLRHSYICEKIGLDNSPFSLKLNGLRKFSVEEFLKLCKLLELDPNDFIE